MYADIPYANFMSNLFRKFRISTSNVDECYAHPYDSRGRKAPSQPVLLPGFLSLKIARLYVSYFFRFKPFAHSAVYIA
jgi:hypothetical protein